MFDKVITCTGHVHGAGGVSSGGSECVHARTNARTVVEYELLLRLRDLVETVMAHGYHFNIARKRIQLLLVTKQQVSVHLMMLMRIEMLKVVMLQMMLVHE